MKIAISGYYGFNNVGDEAILQALIEGFPKDNLYILDSNNRFNFRLISGADAFLSGGGGLLQDKTSAKSFLYYAGLIWYAKLLKKKIYIFAQSIGPASNPINANLLKRTLNVADLITVRDEASFRFLESLKLKKPKIMLTADPTFILTPDIKHLNLKKNFKGPNIGLCFRPYKGMPDDFASTCANLCNMLYGRLQANIYLIPFQRPRDEAFCRQIMQKIKCPAIIWEGIQKPNDILGLISKMDLIVGARLHSLIFAVSMLTSCIGISYDPKVESFMSDAGMPCFAPNDPDLGVKIADAVEQMLENAPGIKHSLELIRQRFYANAMLNFDLSSIIRE